MATHELHQLLEEYRKAFSSGPPNLPPEEQILELERFAKQLSTLSDPEPSILPLLQLDAELRRASSKGSELHKYVYWDRIARVGQFGLSQFEVVYARLKDAVARLELAWGEWRKGDSHPAWQDWMPSNSSPHWTYRAWFVEHLTLVDLQLRRSKLDETTVDDDYAVAVHSIDPNLNCREWLNQVSPVHCDHRAVCRALDAQSTKPTAGVWRVGKYKVTKSIAAGGGSFILLAVDPLSDRTVVLKVPKAPKSDVIRPTQIRSVLDLFREARAHRSLPAIPGLVRVYDVVSPGLSTNMDDDEFLARIRFHLATEPIVIVMDYVPGDSLANVLKDKRGKPFGSSLEVAKLLHGVAQPVRELHKHDRVHRDIKPQNILMEDPAVPVLCDLGLAIPITELDDVESLNRGTLCYLAPEQVNLQFGPVRAATDIWALGVIMFEAATGKRPFDCELPTPKECREEIYRRIQGEQTPAMTQYVPDIDPEFVKICARCLQKHPANRYESVSEFINALTTWIGRQSATEPGSVASDKTRELGLFAWNPQIYSGHASIITHAGRMEA